MRKRKKRYEGGCKGSPRTYPRSSLSMEERRSRLKLRWIASWDVRIGPGWGWVFFQLNFISNEIDTVKEREKKNKVYSMEATIGWKRKEKGKIEWCKVACTPIKPATEHRIDIIRRQRSAITCTQTKRWSVPSRFCLSTALWPWQFAYYYVWSIWCPALPENTVRSTDCELYRKFNNPLTV